MERLFIFISLLVLTACNGLPRDPDGTLSRIYDSGEIRVGLIDNTAHDDEAWGNAAALISRLERHTSATAQFERGSAAVLIPRLEAGEFDLVLGRFDVRSPWSTRVSFASPIAYLRLPPEAQPYRAALPMGENAWIEMVENESYLLRAESPT